jgi:hypothetical protein
MAKEVGGKGGATKISEVDFDRLWRDRVNCELSNQRHWADEYSFMLEGQRKQAGPPAGSQSAAESSAVEASLSLGSTQSTMQASFTQRKSIELKGDTHPFNRKKHPM